MTEPRVTVVTPIHNGRAHTLRFLESLEASSYSNFRVVVVDDGSTDGSAPAIAERFPDATIVRGDGHLWWSAATNLGVRWALRDGADYILTINNDTVVDAHAIRALVDYAELHPRTLVGSMICHEGDPQRVWYFGGFLDRERGDVTHYQGNVTDFTSSFEPEWLTGMGVLIPTEVFREVGFYDATTFPQYFCDTDFSLRAKRRGYTLVVIPESVIYADVSSTWIIRAAERLPWQWFIGVLISLRSPYQFQARYRFYSRYWGSGFRRALFRLYSRLLREELLPLFRVRLKATIKGLAGRLRLAR